MKKISVKNPGYGECSWNLPSLLTLSIKALPYSEQIEVKKSLTTLLEGMLHSMSAACCMEEQSGKALTIIRDSQLEVAKKLQALMRNLH